MVDYDSSSSERLAWLKSDSPEELVNDIDALQVPITLISIHSSGTKWVAYFLIKEKKVTKRKIKGEQ